MLIENKQRLVGIIVLAVFIALLIPFLFVGNSGQKNATPKSVDNVSTATVPVTTAPSNSAVNLPEQTMAANYSQSVPQYPTQAPAAATGGNPPAEQAPAPMPIQSTPDSGEDLSGVPAAMPNQAPQTVTPTTGTIPVTSVTTSVAPTAPTVPVAPVVKPVPVQTVTVPNQVAPTTMQAPVAQVQTAAPVAVVTKPAPVATITTTTTTPTVMATPKKLQSTTVMQPVAKQVVTKNVVIKKTVVQEGSKQLVWVVQIGSFADQKHVQKVVAELKAKGFHGMTQKVQTSHGVLTRIVVGHEATREQAQKVAAQIEKTIKLKGTVIRMHQ